MANGSSQSADRVLSTPMESLVLHEICDAEILSTAPMLALTVMEIMKFDLLDPSAQVVMVDRMLRAGRAELGLSHARRAFALNGAPEMLVRLAGAMVQLGQLDELSALIEIRASEGRESERGLIERIRGILQEEFGNRKKAAKRYRKAASFGDSTSLLLLADLKSEWNRFSREKVSSAYRRAMKAGVTDAGGRYAIHLLDDDSDEAILEALRVSKWSIGRGDVDSLVPFGQALAALQMQGLAEAVLRDALSLGSLDAAPAYVQFMYLEGRQEEAGEWIAERYGGLTPREKSTIDSLRRAHCPGGVAG